MFLSIVVPLLNESANIRPLWVAVGQVITHLPDVKCEVVFVDDGSTDDTCQRIITLDEEVALSWVLVRLSRNFGHQAALSAGITHASGDAIVFLDADLQDPPSLVPLFIEYFRQGYDVVYGIRKNRKEPLWLRICFALFYRLFNSIADRPIPVDAGDCSLISRRVARLISEMPEHDRLIRGMRNWVGFRQIGVPYDRPGRYSGTSRYSLYRRIEGALDGLFGYSRLPIRLSFLVGAGVCLVSGMYLTVSLVGQVFCGFQVVRGWTSLIVLAFMLGGANLVVTSVVGEYVVRIYFQAKGRPAFVVSEVSRSSGEGKAPRS